MIHKRTILAAGAVALACGLPAGLLGADTVAPHVTAAINSFARDMRDKTRDAELKPADVLTFAEVKAGGVVVDLVPGDGYWTKLFSKAVGAQGHVYPLYPVRGYRTLQDQRREEAVAAKAQGKEPPANPFDIPLSIMFISDFRNVKAIAEAIDMYHGNFGIPEQANVVFSSNAYHDFHNRAPGNLWPEPMNMTEINRAIYRAMKPGAVYVISDFAAAPGAGFSATDTLKRAEPEAVKAELTSVGFEFAGSDNALANPADDHTKPADPANKPDRFILKFRKPRNAPDVDRRPRGEVLAKWQHNWIENTFVRGTLATFPSGMYYHADLTLQEEDGNPDSGIIWSTYYWDAQGHNCQYHESPENEGVVVCHPVDSLESMNAETGGYEWAYLAGFNDSKPTRRVMVKGVVRAKASKLGIGLGVPQQ